MLAALPLMGGVVVSQWALTFWDIWTLGDSTLLMMGLAQVVRVLLACWAWTILFRLYRVEGEGDAPAEEAAAA